MTIAEIKAREMSRMLHEWELQLRSKCKYSEETTCTWDDVRELYYAIRNEYLVIDLLTDETLD